LETVQIVEMFGGRSARGNYVHSTLETLGNYNFDANAELLL